MASMEELLADIKRNKGDAIALFDPTGQHVKDVVWPFLEAFVESVHEELTEMGGLITEIQDGEAELLHEDTGNDILQALALGAEIAMALQRTIGQTPNDAGKKWLAKIVAYSNLTKEIVPHVESIMLEEPDDDAAADAADLEDPPAAAEGDK
jgi:hypothetical protein